MAGSAAAGGPERVAGRAQQLLARLGAQRLLGRVDTLLERVNKAWSSSPSGKGRSDAAAAGAGVSARLLDAVNLLTLRRQDLELAPRVDSADVHPPGTAFTLADEKEIVLPSAPRNMEALETLALEKRPEILEESYRKRVTENDIKAAKLYSGPI